MPRRGENIYRRKDGRWEARYVYDLDANGKAKYRSVYARSYSEVKKKLAEQKAMGSVPKKPQNSEPTISSIADMWLSSKKLKVKESTYSKYYDLVKNHIVPTLGQVAVNQLDHMQVERYAEALLQRGRLDGRGGLAPKTVSDILSTLKSILFYAQKHGIATNCYQIQVSVKQERTPMRVLSPSEQKKLTRLLMSDLDCVKLGILLSLYTGLRIGEVCALQWKHIDLEEGLLKVRQTIQRIRNTEDTEGARTRVIIGEPKSRQSIRDIPLPGFIIDILRARKRDPASYVLTESASRYMEPRVLHNRFKRCIGQAGIEPANYHSLRHSFATRCIELGFDVKSLSEILGHADINITLSRYVHSSLELKKQNMRKLDMALLL